MLGKVSRMFMRNDYEINTASYSPKTFFSFHMLLNKLKGVKACDAVKLQGHTKGVVLKCTNNAGTSNMHEVGYNIGLSCFSMNAQNLISELKKGTPETESFRKVVTNITGILSNMPISKQKECSDIRQLYDTKITSDGGKSISFKDLGDSYKNDGLTIEERKKAIKITEKLIGIIAPLRDSNVL